MKRISLLFFLIFLSPLSSADITKESGYLYVASFNVYKLGSVDSKYLSIDEDMGEEPITIGIPDRIKNLSNILSFGKFDLIALQEVTHGARGEAAISDLILDLKDRYNLVYKALHSEHIGRGLMPEMITFLYQPAVVKPEIVSNTNSLTKLIPIDGRDLAQTQWEVGNFDFTLISAHLAWGNELDRIDGYKKLNEIFQSPESFSVDPDILVIGDFNRFGDSQEAVKHLKHEKFIAPNITIFDPKFNDKKRVTKTSIADKGIPNNNPQLLSTTVAKNTYVYDMFLMTDDVSEELGSAPQYGVDWGIFHFDEVDGVAYQTGAELLDHNSLKNAYSDHRPLWFRFKTNVSGSADDDESGQLSSAVTVKYVATEYGKKFHLPHCHTIRNRATSITFDSIETAKLNHSACRVCQPEK